MLSLTELWQQEESLLRPAALALLAFAGLWLLAALWARALGPALRRRAEAKGKHPAARLLLGGFARPVPAFLRVAGVCCALLVLGRQLDADWLPRSLAWLPAALPPFANKALRVAAIIAVAWGLVASSDVSGLLLRNARHKLDIPLGKSVSRFLQALFNVAVIGITVVILLREFGLDVNGLIAGLGLGGLTVALAAKDSFSNFFGGLVLVTEKPFEIGDWVICADTVEGAVEDINLRSTKIRTADGSLTIVPNSTLSGAPITNWGGGMEKRRADFILRFDYSSTRAQMREFTDAARTMLETDPEILSDSIIVRFTTLGESSLEVRIIFYTSNPGFAEHLQVRERVNYALMDIAKRSGLHHAFPARTVFMGAAPNPPAAESTSATSPNPKITTN